MRRLETQIAECESTQQPPAAAPPAPTATPPDEPRGVWAAPPETPGIYAGPAKAGAGPGVAVKTESPRGDHQRDVIPDPSAGGSRLQELRQAEESARADLQTRLVIQRRGRGDVEDTEAGDIQRLERRHMEEMARRGDSLAAGSPRGDQPCAVIPGSNAEDSKLQDLLREEEMARETYARLFKQRLRYERTVKTEAGDTEEAPPVPVHTDAPPVEDHPYHPVSPFDVGSHSMAQVEKADKFLE